MTSGVSEVVTPILLKIRLFCGGKPCRLASSYGRFEKILVEEDCQVPKMKARTYFAMSESIYQSIRRHVTEDIH